MTQSQVYVYSVGISVLLIEPRHTGRLGPGVNHWGLVGMSALEV